MRPGRRGSLCAAAAVALAGMVQAGETGTTTTPEAAGKKDAATRSATTTDCKSCTARHESLQRLQDVRADKAEE